MLQDLDELEWTEQEAMESFEDTQDKDTMHVIDASPSQWTHPLPDLFQPSGLELLFHPPAISKTEAIPFNSDDANDAASVGVVFTPATDAGSNFKVHKSGFSDKLFHEMTDTWTMSHLSAIIDEIDPSQQKFEWPTASNQKTPVPVKNCEIDYPLDIDFLDDLKSVASPLPVVMKIAQKLEISDIVTEAADVETVSIKNSAFSIEARYLNVSHQQLCGISRIHYLNKNCFISET